MADNDVRSNLNEEEKRRLERIDRLDSNKKRKKVILAAVTCVLILFFVVGTVFGINYILQFEGTEALPVEKELFAVPEGEDAVLNTLEELVAGVGAPESTKLDISFSASISDESIEISGDNAEAIRTYFDYIKGSVEGVIASCYEKESHKGAYGEDFSELMFSTAVGADDAEITAVVPEENENELFLEIKLDGCSFSEVKNTIAYDMFDISASEEAFSLLREKLGGMAECENALLSYEPFLARARVDREKSSLSYVTFERVCNVTLPLEFVGEYADFGNVVLSFSVKLTKTFSFTRVEFFFNQDVFYVEKGANDEIKTTVISDSTDYSSIKYVSSNPEVLSIDGRFFKANKVSAEPVTVTASYTYNGVEYKDECIFYVRVPVEGVKLAEKELSLKVGEEHTISAVLSPDDATLTKVYWFTDNADVIEIDTDSGVFTAKKPGTASVYCITLDGNYKSGCTVEVSE